VSNCRTSGTRIPGEARNRLRIILKPIAIPALFGVSLTMLSLDLIGEPRHKLHALAQDRIAEQLCLRYNAGSNHRTKMIRFAATTATAGMSR